MIEIQVQIHWGLLALAGLVGMVLAGLYALALSTPRGLEVCERRMYWTVVGGHLLMAVSMGFVSAPLAGLWLLWSAMHGLPLVIRSEVLHWRQDKRMERAGMAAVAGALRVVGSGGMSDEAGNDCGRRSGPGEDCAGD